MANIYSAYSGITFLNNCDYLVNVGVDRARREQLKRSVSPGADVDLKQALGQSSEFFRAGGSSPLPADPAKVREAVDLALVLLSELLDSLPLFVRRYFYLFMNMEDRYLYLELRQICQILVSQCYDALFPESAEYLNTRWFFIASIPELVGLILATAPGVRQGDRELRDLLHVLLDDVRRSVFSAYC